MTVEKTTRAEMFDPVSCIRGRVNVPGDKSITHRSILFGMLAAGETRIRGWLDAADCRSSLRVAQQVGAKVTMSSDEIVLSGTGGNLIEPTDVLDCGNSGTTMRLFTGAFAARLPFGCLTGDESLRRRPMGRVTRPLAQMGADIVTGPRGTAPFAVRGHNLRGFTYELPVASAQVKSALLLAGALADEGTTTILEKNSTRDHTERMLPAFGVQVDVRRESDISAISVSGNSAFRGTDVTVPGDPSSAAFLLCAAAILPDSEVTVTNISVNPTRVGFLHVLERMGAQVEVSNERILAGEPIADVTVRHRELRGTDIEKEIVPSLIDELPILSVVAARARGTTRIYGAEELRVKETDRIKAIVEGLSVIGVQAAELPDGFVIEGGAIGGGRVKSYGDHRIAMSFAIAGLASKNGVAIEQWEAVDISFPSFQSLLGKLLEGSRNPI